MTSHTPSTNYGDSFESIIITAMITLIVASFIFVGWIWQKYTPECSHSEYTYCGEDTSGHHKNSHASTQHANPNHD